MERERKTAKSEDQTRAQRRRRGNQSEKERLLSLKSKLERREGEEWIRARKKDSHV